MLKKQHYNFLFQAITRRQLLIVNAYFVMRVGAFLPGIKAVVMMMSHSRACFANSSISALMNSGLISLA